MTLPLSAFITAAFDKDIYLNKMTNMLSDENIYTVLNKNLIRKLINGLHELLGRWTNHNYILDTMYKCLMGMLAYLREEVIVDLHATICKQLSEMRGWADEEIIAHDIRYRFLILIAVIYLIPIGILKQKSEQIPVKDCQLASKNVILSNRFNNSKRVLHSLQYMSKEKMICKV